MNKLYPIKFTAEPRERVWGGNYLKNKLGKEFEKGKIGESWELWSLFGKSSVVAEGFLAGNTLDDIIETYMGDAIGDRVFEFYKGDFPLLIKILDIEDRLSIQVHPDDQIAFEREDSYGKSEFWYIMDAKPDAKIYMGFNRDITPSEFYERCKNGTLEQVLNIFTPHIGDCIYIEPGCVHSAGNGVVIAEIQQASDVTYRLYDWGRENNPKTARRMDLEEAIDIIDYTKYNSERYYFPQVTGSKTIVDSSHFIIKTFDITENIRIVPNILNSFIIYICTRGEAHIKMNDGTLYPIKRGETIYIPSGMEDFLLVPDKGNPHLLEVYMPQLEEDPDSYLDQDAEDEYHHHHDNEACSCHGHAHDHNHEHDAEHLK
ncbi:MAG: type I phosphomannose isomerase catalytic subunit [Bacteroidales bacterium]